jgi:two-component system cell cycle response regulator
MRRIAVTVSIGVAARQAGDMTATEVLKRADDALYRAKQSGRNKVVAAAA